jgi:hypothetical protein
MTAAAPGAHQWSAWRPVERGLFESRCTCGCDAVERATLEALLAEALTAPRLGSRGRLEALVLSTRAARRRP